MYVYSDDVKSTLETAVCIYIDILCIYMDIYIHKYLYASI